MESNVKHLSAHRVHVSLDPDVHSSLARIAKVGGTSMSAIVREMLQGQRQVLAQLADTLEHAQALKGSLTGEQKARLEEIEGDLISRAEEASQTLSDTLREPRRLDDEEGAA